MVRYFASLLYSLANLLQQVLRVLYAATTVYVEDKMIQTSPSLRRSQKYLHLSIVYTLKYCPWLLKILLMSTHSMFLQKNPKRVGQCPGERLQSLRSVINEWRSLTWTQNYGNCAWGPNTLLPDAVVTKLAARAHISTLDDIKNDIPEWDFVDNYGSTLLELIQKTDDIWKENHAQELQTKKDLRKRRSIENKEQREEERCIKKRAETAQ